MIPITFKSIAGQEIKLKFSPSTKVEVVKENIVREFKKAFPKSKITTTTHFLVFQSRILKDDQTIGDYDLEVNSTVFIQPMTSFSERGQKYSKKRPVTPNRFHIRNDNANVVSNFDVNSPPASSLPNYEENIAKLLEMGYSRKECESALQSAFNDPFLAADYLSTYSDSSNFFPISQVPVDEPPFIQSEVCEGAEHTQPDYTGKINLHQFEIIEDPITGETKKFELATIIQVFKAVGEDIDSTKECLASMEPDLQFC